MTGTDETASAKPGVAECQRDRRGDVLAYAAVGYIGLFSAALMFKAISEGVTGNMLSVIAGAMVMIVKDVYGFQFGSSQGSQQKTDQLGAAVTALQNKEPHA